VLLSGAKLGTVAPVVSAARTGESAPPVQTNPASIPQVSRDFDAVFDPDIVFSTLFLVAVGQKSGLSAVGVGMREWLK
jgi:hypothetical protein